jgi:hypothetical protein
VTVVTGPAFPRQPGFLQAETIIANSEINDIKFLHFIL